MDFKTLDWQTIDWEQLALQTASAFGLKNAEQSEGWPASMDGYLEPVDINSYVLGTHLDESVLSFDVTIWGPEIKSVSLQIWPDGQIDGTERRFSDWDEGCLEVLLKGLFHLSLLTPEVEAALETSISAHEKIEWALEHQERLEIENAAPTIDWDAEAMRVKLAFGLEGSCRFVSTGGRYTLQQNKTYPRFTDGSELDCHYFYFKGRFSRHFTIRRYQEQVTYNNSLWITSDGRAKRGLEPNPDSLSSHILARALFLLGLLSDEVEATLEVSISAAEKLTWTREYKSRYEFENIDWDAEAKRVRRAFGFDEVCEFRCWEHDDKERYFLIENAPIPKSLKLHELNGGRGFAWYGELQRFFGVAQYSSGIAVWLNWEGKLTMVRKPDDSEDADKRDAMKLAQTLFHLDLLTPAIETEMGVSISSHQKMEWRLEYEARYGV